GEVGEFLEKYLEENEVSCFSVGNPLQTDGSPSSSAPHARGLVKRLRNQFPDVPVELTDERFTSVMARRASLEAGTGKSERRKKELVDKVSATIILQGWMETKKYGSGCEGK